MAPKTPGAPPGPGTALLGDSAVGTLSGAAQSRSAVLSRVRHLLRPLADDLLTTFLPSQCRICGVALTRAGRLPVCPECRALKPQTGPLCSTCGEALDMESARFEQGFAPSKGVLCDPCRMVPPHFERAVAYTPYEGSPRELLHLLKYEGMHPVAALLAPALAQAIATLPLTSPTVVAPVPLFPAKERARGYNQSDLLAREALRLLRTSNPALRLEYEPTLLVRKRSTESQFALSKRGRRRNLQGAFAVHSTGLRAGSQVLLIDDIYTSGATARECARVLRRAGAARVWVATLARSQRPQVALWDQTAQKPAIGFG